MLAAAASSSTFPLFSSLPLELRDQIWRDALPGKVGPALYTYRKGCWCPRRLSKSEEEYDPENDENNSNFEFRYDLLDDAEFEVSLFFVNREARSIALAWLREQRIEIRPCEDRHYPVFVKAFEPLRDALYVPLDKWDNFVSELVGRIFEPDFFEQLLHVKPGITRIALPEALFRSKIDTARDLSVLLRVFQIETLFVVVGAQPDLQSADNDMKVQRRWEFESTQGGALIWDGSRGCFEFGNVYIDDANLYELLAKATEELGAGFAGHHICNFEFRPVFAIGR